MEKKMADQLVAAVTRVCLQFQELFPAVYVLLGCVSDCKMASLVSLYQR